MENTDNTPVIEESGSFRSLHLDDNADSNGTQDSGEFGIIPAEEGILDGMRYDFSGREILKLLCATYCAILPRCGVFET